MKKTLMMGILLSGILNSYAQYGTVMDALTMNSEILQMERKYAIYLPPDYQSSQRKYPVLYLLHGLGDDQTGWIQFGEVLHITDEAIKTGLATPMIIIMPDANTGGPGYVNDINGKWRYEDFFFEEFIPFIEKAYPIKAEKRYRAIAGLSMGGEGTYIYALHHPELFSSACPLSAATGPTEVTDTRDYFLWKIDDTITDASVEAYFKQNSVLSLLENMPESQFNEVRWYIDCGDDDFLFEGNSRVHILMRNKNIPHEYRVRNGGHGWSYWRESLPQVLKFVSDSFHQQ